MQDEINFQNCKHPVKKCHISFWIEAIIANTLPSSTIQKCTNCRMRVIFKIGDFLLKSKTHIFNRMGAIFANPLTTTDRCTFLQKIKQLLQTLFLPQLVKNVQIAG